MAIEFPNKRAMSIRRWIIGLVSRLKPGEHIAIDSQMIEEAFRSFWHKGAQFTPADRVLENVVGSAWGWSYSEDLYNRHITFKRILDDGERTYVSPDRRE